MSTRVLPLNSVLETCECHYFTCLLSERMDVWNRTCIPTQLHTVGAYDLLGQRLLTFTVFFLFSYFSNYCHPIKKLLESRAQGDVPVAHLGDK